MRIAVVVSLVVVLCAGVGAAVTIRSGSADGARDAAADSVPARINGYRSVGYFPQWGIYDRLFTFQDLQEAGTADSLTHINYAFGNISHESLSCFMANKAQGTGPDGSDGAGDAWADYGMAYTAETSIDGTADTPDQPLAGSFNQLRQLKAQNPGLSAVISLGGWTWSKNFSKAAATAESRQRLVSSCIDMYLKGNLPVIDGRGGQGAAAGVFDGIDIDWEWPGTDAGLEGNGVDEANDAENLRLLLKEFRKQLDAYGAETGRSYSLSAFLPANPAHISAGGWDNPELYDYLDFGNIQGYDLWGSWEPTMTGHQGNLFDDPADPRADGERFSIDVAVQAYLDAGIDPAQLGLGLAAYGRGWAGAASPDPWKGASGPGPGSVEAGLEDYDKLRSLGTERIDGDLAAAWRHDGDQWWSYDNEETIKLKGDYIAEKRLGGGMWWELAGNRDGSLMSVLAQKLRQAPKGSAVDYEIPGATPAPAASGTADVSGTADAPAAAAEPSPWEETAVYTEGAKVDHDGLVYTAKWWTRGDRPGTQEWGPWEPDAG
jgi:chitinase